MIVVRRFTDAASFAQIVSPYLLPHEAVNNLPFRILGRFATRTEAVPPGVYLAAAFASAEPGAALLGVALRTPPFMLALGYPSAAALPELLAEAHAFGALPGVVGEAQEAARAAEWWTRTHGGSHQLKMALRVHQLERVAIQPGSGRVRPATEADRPLLTTWEHAFHAEALPNDPAPSAPLSLGGLHVWELEGEVVSMVRGIACPPNIAVINAVYTPPSHRGRGYATSAVAALSQLHLQQGRSRCVLFTDLANPISNAIYRRIGYRPVADFSNLRFDA